MKLNDKAPQWLGAMRKPWRFISGRVADVETFCHLVGLESPNCAFHYPTAKHVEGVRTIWPFLLIESDEADTMAAFLAGKVLAGVYRSGNDVIRIPRSVLRTGCFEDDLNLCASTMVQIALRKERATRKPRPKRIIVEPQDLRLTQVASAPRWGELCSDGFHEPKRSPPKLRQKKNAGIASLVLDASALL